MKTLFIECNMGAAGDMLMAALIELCPDADKFIEKMNSIGMKDVTVHMQKTEEYGICGTGIDVIINGITEDILHKLQHSHNHSHQSIGDVTTLIHSLDIPENVKEKACTVYSVLAEAEAHVHGQTVEHIHFHEVGTLDAVCDIVGCCLAMDIISPDNVIISPIHVGFGTVKCQHGILPVPTPATAYILQGVPIYGGEIQGELCTPTGAALLKTFADSFGAMPVMNIEKIGYGMGKRDFGRLNCVRAFIGESVDKSCNVYSISCNLDDITSEELAFSYDKLFETGAIDVFTVAAVMKKGRAAHILTALAYESDKNAVAKSMLKHTTTLGVRILPCERMTLQHHHEKVETIYGSIDIKVSSGHGITKIKPEYDCVASAAKEHDTTFINVKETALCAFIDKLN